MSQGQKIALFAAISVLALWSFSRAYKHRDGLPVLLHAPNGLLYKATWVAAKEPGGGTIVFPSGYRLPLHWFPWKPEYDSHGRLTGNKIYSNEDWCSAEGTFGDTYCRFLDLKEQEWTVQFSFLEGLAEGVAFMIVCIVLIGTVIWLVRKRSTRQ